MKTIKLNQTKGIEIYIPINRISHFFQVKGHIEGPDGSLSIGTATLVYLTNKNGPHFQIKETPGEIALLLAEAK